MLPCGWSYPMSVLNLVPELRTIVACQRRCSWRIWVWNRAVNRRCLPTIGKRRRGSQGAAGGPAARGATDPLRVSAVQGDKLLLAPRPSGAERREADGDERGHKGRGSLRERPARGLLHGLRRRSVALCCPEAVAARVGGRDGV